MLGPDGGPLDIEALGERVAELLAAVHRGDAETDNLNRLVITAGLDRRQVAILRAYRKYRQRVGSRFTESYQNDVLVANSGGHGQARALLRAALRPRAGDRRGGRGRRCATRSCADLDEVASLDHDRILRNQLAADRRDAAHERLQRRPRGAGLQAALGRRAGDAAAGAVRRDLRLLARGRGHPPARRRRSPAAACAGRTARTTAPRSSG